MGSQQSNSIMTDKQQDILRSLRINNKNAQHICGDVFASSTYDGAGFIRNYVNQSTEYIDGRVKISAVSDGFGNSAVRLYTANDDWEMLLDPIYLKQIVDLRDKDNTRLYPEAGLIVVTNNHFTTYGALALDGRLVFPMAADNIVPITKEICAIRLGDQINLVSILSKKYIKTEITGASRLTTAYISPKTGNYHLMVEVGGRFLDIAIDTSGKRVPQ